MNLEISIEQNSWNKIKIQSIVNECAQATFSELKLDDSSVEICFLFTNDEEIRTLNKTYRKVDKPTNVLSFPTDLVSGSFSNNSKECPSILGSIAIAFETTKLESIKQKKSFEDHLKHLIVHGILHLLGYDHIESNKIIQMETLEVRILAKINVCNPYE